MGKEYIIAHNIPFENTYKVFERGREKEIKQDAIERIRSVHPCVRRVLFDCQTLDAYPQVHLQEIEVG